MEFYWRTPKPTGREIWDDVRGTRGSRTSPSGRKLVAYGELLTFQNERGLNLDGILWGPTSNSTVVVHVHGSHGNFYQNRWLRKFAAIYNHHDISFFSFNLTGHDGIAESVRRDRWEYIGGAFGAFEECVPDIAGALAFGLGGKEHAAKVLDMLEKDIKR